MKAVLTCDDVFDILTREPFPSGGATDEVVESHLAVCHECRQLAEAFRPAVGLFHESLSAEFEDELPIYRGRMKPIIGSLPQVSPRASQKALLLNERRPASSHRWIALATSLLVAGSVIFAAWATNWRADDIAPVVTHLRLHENRDDRLLAALEIPPSCHTVTEAANMAAAAERACCTKCHNAASRVASTEKAILKSSAACVACHDGRLDEALSAIEYDRVRTRIRLLGSIISSMGV